MNRHTGRSPTLIFRLSFICDFDGLPSLGGKAGKLSLRCLRGLSSLGDVRSSSPLSLDLLVHPLLKSELFSSGLGGTLGEKKCRCCGSGEEEVSPTGWVRI
jgi:hypothetical protein